MKNYIIYKLYTLKYTFLILSNYILAKDDYQRNLHLAEWFAFKQHNKARQRYDDKYPYYYHLRMVCNNVKRFGQNLNRKEYRIVYIAALLHDFIEDLTFTYNDIKSKFGVEIADAVFACTELRGKNRKERHGPLYYKGLNENRHGGFVKLCDVHANMTMGKRTGSRMLDMYQKDYPSFKNKLIIYNNEFAHIFQSIEFELMPASMIGTY